MNKSHIKDGRHSRAHTLNKPILPKRFYKMAVYNKTENGYQILLDDKILKAPSRANIFIRSELLAKNIVIEWNSQSTHINTHTMPLTKLIFTAIDAVEPQKNEVIDELVRYACSDLICYWEAAPEKLVERQRTAWQPILDWAKTIYNLEFITTNTISPITQPSTSLQNFRNIISSFSQIELTTFYTLTTFLGSTLLALAVLKQYVSASEAWEAAHIDEQWNREKWGEDAEDIKLRTDNYKLYHAIVENIPELK